jgi:hypothetical protein
MPDAGQARFAAALNAELTERDDDYFFEGAKIGVDVSHPSPEIENGVTDDLPWAVKGDVSAAIGFDEIRIERRKRLVADEEMVPLSRAAQGVGGGMLDEKKNVGDVVSLPHLDETAL